HRLGPPIQPELFTLVLTGSIHSLLAGRERAAFERTTMPRFIVGQRWFAGKGSSIQSLQLTDYAALPSRRGDAPFLLTLLAVALRNAEPQDYFVPLAIEEGNEDESLLPYAVSRVRRG